MRIYKELMRISVMALAVMTPSIAGAVKIQDDNTYRNYDEMKAVHVSEAMDGVRKAPANAKVNLHIDCPEDMKIGSIHIYSINNPYGRWYTEVMTDQSFNWWVDDEAFFCVQCSDKNKKTYVFISPDFPITNETNVNLDMRDCVNEINFKLMLPDKSEGYPDTFNDKGELLSMGNISSGIAYTHIQRRGTPITTWSLITPMINYDLGTMKVNNTGGFMTNNLSEDYEVVCCQEFIITDSELQSLVFTSTNGADIREQKTVCNNPDNFTSLHADYTAPPAGPYDITDAEWYGYDVAFRSDNLWTDTGYGSYTSHEQANQNLVCMTLCENHRVEPVLSIGKCFTDNGLSYTERIFYPICSARMSITAAGKVVFMPSHTDDSMTFEHIGIPDTGIPSPHYFPFSIHPRFTWECDFKNGEKPHFGNSTPMLTLTTLWNSSYMGSLIEPYYIGRLGELRTCDECNRSLKSGPDAHSKMGHALGFANI